MKRTAALVLAVVLVAGGLWLAQGLAPVQAWLFGAGLVGLVGIVTESFLDRPTAEWPKDRYQGFTLWIAPGLLVVAGLWVGQLTLADSQLPLAAAVAGLMGVLLLSLRASLEPAGRFYRPGRFAANLILYLAVFLLLALIYYTRERSLVTATATGLVALLATVEILRTPEGVDRSDRLVATLAALIVAETTWVLNYWPVSGLVGGAILLLTFYVFGGLLTAIRDGGLDRRLLAEYGTVGIVGLFAVALAMQ